MRFYNTLISFRQKKVYKCLCAMSLAKVPVCFMESKDGSGCGDSEELKP